MAGTVTRGGVLQGSLVTRGRVVSRGLSGIGEAVVQIITATLAPATSVLVVGEALQDTTNWATFINTTNYATSAGGETISTVTVNYIGDTATAAEAFLDGESNHFSITVTDTAANSRTFTTNARTVAAASSGDSLLLEIGDYLLLENCDKLLLEAA